jgi:hypothetical protein
LQDTPKFTKNWIFGLKIYHLATLAQTQFSQNRYITLCAVEKDQNVWAMQYFSKNCHERTIAQWAKTRPIRSPCRSLNVGRFLKRKLAKRGFHNVRRSVG